MPFAVLGQTFQPHDLLIVLLLIALEGVLSVDNALVLGLLAKKLPEAQRSKALTYGLVGALVFRFVALACATFLLKWTIFKAIGGLYLLWVAFKHFVLDRRGPDGDAGVRGGAKGALGKFWPTVLVVELTDLAFAIDSIVAAIGVVGPAPRGSDPDGLHPKLWVVLTGGFLGVVLMRFAAVLFIRLLEKFPRFETAAYLLVTLIAVKLLVAFAAHAADYHGIRFHDPHNAAFWAFWAAMVACFASGFFGRRNQQKPA